MPIFSKKFMYFQKPLILQNIQWYIRITGKYESIWPMRNWSNSSLKRWHIWSIFFPSKSVSLLWIKKSQEIHRNAYIFWNSPPIRRNLDQNWQSYQHLSSSIIIILIPQIATNRVLRNRSNNVHFGFEIREIFMNKQLQMFML